jgi:hypothetical protein
MIFVWFITRLIANNVGGSEPLEFNSVTSGPAPVLTVAIDLNRPRPELAPRTA